MEKLNEILKIELPKMNTEKGIYMALMAFSLTFVAFATYYLINIGNKHIEEHRRVNLKFSVILKWVAYIVAAILVVIAINNINSLRYLLNSLFASVVIAYVLNPIVVWLEKKYPNIKRKWWILIIFTVLLLIISFMALTIVPRVVNETKKFFNNLNYYINDAKTVLVDLSNKYFGKDIFNLKDIKVNDIVDKLGLNKGDFNSMLSGVKSTFSKIFAGIMVPIFVFYFLNDKEMFIAAAKKMIPNKYRDTTIGLAREMDKNVIKYVKGKLILAVYVGFVSGAMLSIFRVDFAIVIGLITMFADIIPFIGPFLGFVPAVIFALLDSPTKALFVMILFPVLQWTENYLVAPKVMSDQLGIHPMLVLVLTLIGGFLYGFIGMIFALPITIAAKIIYKYYKDKKKNINELTNPIED